LKERGIFEKESSTLGLKVEEKNGTKNIL